MKRILVLCLFLAAIGLVAPADTVAQDEHNFMAVGEMAPDIEFVGATRYGVFQEPLKLSDFRGETVVLAFFFRVRTRG